MREIKTTFVLIFLMFLVPRMSFANHQAAMEVQNRLSQIFYWHLADELHISAVQEKQMIAILEDVQKKRSQALDARDEALIHLKQLEKTPGDKNAKGYLNSYIESLGKLATLDREEFDRLRKIFGDDALARFLIIRDEVTDHIRNSIHKAPTSAEK